MFLVHARRFSSADYFHQNVQLQDHSNGITMVVLLVNPLHNQIDPKREQKQKHSICVTNSPSPVQVILFCHFVALITLLQLQEETFGDAGGFPDVRNKWKYLGRTGFSIHKVCRSCRTIGRLLGMGTVFTLLRPCILYYINDCVFEVLNKTWLCSGIMTNTI